DEGSFSLAVRVADDPPSTLFFTSPASTATVSEGDALTAHPTTFAATAGEPFTGTVGTFSDSYLGNVASDFTAIIDWGDGTTTAGTVTGGGGTFSVSGTHTYAARGIYAVKAALIDDAPGTAKATANSTANVDVAD